jgi:hypothetical protein
MAGLVIDIYIGFIADMELRIHVDPKTPARFFRVLD